jgi:lysosomal alpha-mannosidase
MGYDGIFFGRLDYQEKEQRTAEKTLQMVWKVNENARKKQNK